MKEELPVVKHANNEQELNILVSGTRLKITLLHPVKVPPIPDDDVYAEYGKVYAKFAMSSDPGQAVHIGWLDDRAVRRVARVDLELLSSGNGYEVPARTVDRQLFRVGHGDGSNMDAPLQP